MNNLIEQAIEALEAYVTTIAKAGGGDRQLFMAAIREADDKARATIINLRDHLELLAKQPLSALPPLPEPDERTRKGLAFSGFAMEAYARAALRAAIAQPAAERQKFTKEWCMKMAELEAQSTSEVDVGAQPAAGELTDEEIYEIADSDQANPDDRGWGPKFSHIGFARAVLAAQRERDAQQRARSLCRKCGKQHPNPDCDYIVPADMEPPNEEHSFTVVTFEPTEEMERAFNRICPVGEDFGDAWAAACAVSPKPGVVGPPIKVPDRMGPWVNLHNITAFEFTAFHIGFCCGEQSQRESDEARDAARYRWLRSQHESGKATSFAVFAPDSDDENTATHYEVGFGIGELDAAIDSAMSTTKGEK